MTPAESLARDYAAGLHADQKYGDQPYTAHLLAVRQVLADFGVEDGPLAVAAWLHDVLEDTDATREELARVFGDDVATLVEAVTGRGKNRRERNRDMYQKVRHCPLLAAAMLKVADRIANVEASAHNPSKMAMYRRERHEFGRATMGKLVPREMLERLERAYEAGG